MTLFRIILLVVFLIRILPVNANPIQSLLFNALYRTESIPSPRFKGLIYSIARIAQSGVTFFTKKRVAELEKIVANGGSIQTIECMTYEEFQRIDKSKLSEAALNKYKTIHDSLNGRIAKLSKKFATLQGTVTIGKIQKDLVSEVKNEEDKNKWAVHKMVMECKKFIRKAFSHEGEGSYLDIFSFINSWYFLKSKYHELGNIYELSKLQSPELDIMVLETLYEERDKFIAQQPESQQQGKRFFNKVLIEGAGPVGLYTAFQLFLIGLDVTVINNRSEIYERRQIVVLDPIWTYQLSYFLGTKFQELFGDEKKENISDTRIGHFAQNNLNVLEDVMKQRLVELASFAGVFKKVKQEKIEKGNNTSEKTNDNESPPLILLYEASLKEIHLATKSDPSFYAILSPLSKTTKEHVQYIRNQIEIKKSKIKQQRPDISSDSASREAKRELENEKILYAQHILGAENASSGIDIDEPIIKHNDRKISIKEYAKLVVDGKTPELRHLPNISFDLLICAGGAKDVIRTTYLGYPKQKSLRKSFGVGMWQKGEKLPKTHLAPISFVYQPFKKVSMQALKPLLEAQNFDKLIEDSAFLPESLRRNYKHLTAMMLQGVTCDGNVCEGNSENISLKPDNGDPARRHIVVGFRETKNTFFVFAETDWALDIFVANLKSEMGKIKNDEPKLKLYKQFLEELERKWFAALANKFVQKKPTDDIINMDIDRPNPGKLNSDSNKSSTSIFEFVHTALEHPAKFYAAFGISILIMALGDALATPNFLSASGLSTSRIGVEGIKQVLRNYRDGKITSENELLISINEKLKLAKELTTEKVKQHLTVSSDQFSNVNATMEMFEIVNEKCKNARPAKDLQSEYDYNVICQYGKLDSENFSFVLEVKGRQPYNAQVTKKGEIEVEGGKAPYDTFIEAVFALKT